MNFKEAMQTVTEEDVTACCTELKQRAKAYAKSLVWPPLWFAYGDTTYPGTSTKAVWFELRFLLVYLRIRWHMPTILSVGFHICLDPAAPDQRGREELYRSFMCIKFGLLNLQLELGVLTFPYVRTVQQCLAKRKVI